MSVMKIFCSRHVMGEILVRELVHFDTDLFISIMFELGCTKFGIDQKAIVDLLITPLDASLSPIIGNMIFELRDGPKFFSMKLLLATISLKRCPQVQ